MADKPVTPATVTLAGWAAELAIDLSSIPEYCGHDSTSWDIQSIASELTLLSTTLWHLHEAMLADPESYTMSFNQDLNEILEELKRVFEEISECCNELQKADKPTGIVIWLFKKSKVHHLQKHLAALKTTLLVMRTVLYHGKDYGLPPSDHGYDSDSGPHTMHEDRAIIESILSQNRDAILDLHDFDPSNNLHCQRSPSKRKDECCHDRVRSCSVELPPIPDIIPATATVESHSPRRSPSKRGVRLGVHMSILDLGAHDAPDRLKDKWVRTSRSHQYPSRKKKSRASFSGGHVLGKISEAESSIEIPPVEDLSSLTIFSPPGKKDETETSSGHNGHSGSPSQGIMTRPVSKGLHKMKSVVERLKPRGGRRSPTQEELEIEIENYGSV